MDQGKIQILLDRMEISDTVIRYATGIDMRDWEAYRSCFTEEVEIDFSSFAGGGPERLSADRWVRRVRRIVEGFRSTQHISTNHVVRIRGDEATCVSYMVAQHYLPNDQGDNTCTLGGYYTNELVRTPKGWRIRRCKLTVTWSSGNRHVFDLARGRPRQTHGSPSE